MEAMSSSCGYFLLFLLFTLLNASLVSTSARHDRYPDSMAYDDLIRDVPRYFRRAQDRSSSLMDSIRHVKSLSVSAGMEDLVRQYRNGDDSFVSSFRHFSSSSRYPNHTNHRHRSPHTHSTTNTSSAFSPECKKHIAAFFDGTFRGEEWAIRMLDAWGKPQSGILEANIRSFGDYHECRAVRGVQSTGGVNVTLRGQYCLVNIGVYDEDGVIDVSAQEGMCMPDACSQDEIYSLVKGILQRYNVTKHFQNVSVTCHYDQSMDGWAIFAIVFIIILAIVAVAATLVDFAYPVVVPVAWAEEEEKAEGRNGRNSINSNDDNTQNNNNNNQNSHLLSFPSNNHVVSSDYQPLTPTQAYSNRLREQTPIQILLCFSLRANFIKLMDTGSKEDAMGCIHGLRFFTISWIIIGHTILVTSKRSVNFVAYAQQTVPYIFYQLLVNGTFGCDSFLCFSGILVCYNLMHTLKYFKGKMRWHLFYMYRYIRLTPAMAVVMLVYVTTFPYWYDGPIWMQGGLEPQRCRDSWWRNLLYINNYFHQQCMGWLWYLAVDTQLYAISPIFAIILYKKPRIGLYVIGVTLVLTTALTAYIAYDTQISPSSFTVMQKGLEVKGDPMVEYYYAPYCRLSPYLIGMLAGYLLYAKDRKLEIHWVWQLLGWLFVVSSSTYVVFGLYKAAMFQTDQQPMDLTGAVLYNTLARPVWGFGVAWTIVMCVTGHGGFLNKVLSWKPLVPFARTTYMAYMLHVIIICWYVMASQRPIYITDPFLFVHFFGFIFMTYLIAFPATLLVEAPVMALQKMLINRHNKKKATVDNNKRSPVATNQHENDQGEE